MKNSRLYWVTDDIYLLHIIHNLGATAPERALSAEEISRLTYMEKRRVEENLKKLMEKGYLDFREESGVKKYFVTVSGIRKALSIYS